MYRKVLIESKNVKFGGGRGMRKLLHFLLLCGFVINFSCSVSDESQQKSVNEERHHASAEQETDAQVRRSHHIRATVTQKATKHRRQIRWRRDDRGKWKKAREWMEERWEGIRAGRKPIRWIVILKAVEFRFGKNPYHTQNLTDVQRKERAERFKTSLSHDKRTENVAKFPLLS